MARVYSDTDCPLHGSDYCKRLNMESCKSCTVNCSTEEDAENIARDLDRIEAAMPEDGIAELFAGDGCVLCRHEPNKKSCYALTDLGNAAPKRRKAKLFGIKREPRAGMILPIQLACCDECKKRFTRLEYARPVIGTAFTVAAFIIMSIRPVREAIARVTPSLPFILFAIAVAAGILIGTAVKANLMKKYAREMRLNIFDIPKLAEMREMGWFELYPEKGYSKLVFSKSPISRGLYTAMPVITEAGGVDEAATGGADAPEE